MLTTTTIVWKYAEKKYQLFSTLFIYKSTVVVSKYKYRYKVHFLQEMHKNYSIKVWTAIINAYSSDLPIVDIFQCASAYKGFNATIQICAGADKGRC